MRCLLGDNGILSKAKTAKEQSNAADIEEQNKLGKYNETIEGFASSRGSNDSSFTWDIGTNYIAKKYDNGVMELYGKYTGKMTTNYTWISSVYYQDYVNMAFPVHFVNTPYLTPVLCREGSNSALNIIPRTIDSNGFNYYVISMGSPDNNTPYSISYTAVGYWK